MSEDVKTPPTMDAEVVDAPPAEDTKLAAAARAVITRAESLSVELVDGAAAPRTLDEQLKVAKWAWSSGLLPRAIDSTAKAWMVMQRGAELGFPGLTAFEFLYVVQNQVRLKPAGAKAKALASGLLVDYQEEIVGEGEAMLARVTIKRRGIPTLIVTEFSVQDAKTASLWAKSGPRGDSAWVTYPQRMLLARARGFAYGDTFADLIGGLQVREAYDLEPGESLAPAKPVVGRRAELPPAPPTPDPLLRELAGQAQAPAPELVTRAPFDPKASAELDKQEAQKGLPLD